MTTAYHDMTAKAFRKLSAPRRKSNMTWWSRDDPVMNPVGNADHWSKMRVKANNFEAGKDKYGGLKFTPREQENVKREAWRRHHGYVDLGAKGEGSATSRVQRSAPVQSAAGKRAQEGFSYWYQERPKPTSFGKYGIGSYKTVLGLGNAPRT